MYGSLSNIWTVWLKTKVRFNWTCFTIGTDAWWNSCFLFALILDLVVHLLWRAKGKETRRIETNQQRAIIAALVIVGNWNGFTPHCSASFGFAYRPFVCALCEHSFLALLIMYTFPTTAVCIGNMLNPIHPTRPFNWQGTFSLRVPYCFSRNKSIFNLRFRVRSSCQQVLIV